MQLNENFLRAPLVEAIKFLFTSHDIKTLPNVTHDYKVVWQQKMCVR